MLKLSKALLIFVSTIALASCGESEADRKISEEIKQVNEKNQKCEPVRDEVTSLKSDNLKSTEAKSINQLQARLFTERMKELFSVGSITMKQWELFVDITENNPFNQIFKSEKDNVVGRDTKTTVNIENYFEKRSDLESLIVSLINKNELSPYFFPQVIERGDNLAKRGNPEYDIILKNQECFSNLDVQMAKSFSELKLSSNWGTKKTAQELLDVYSQNIGR